MAVFIKINEIFLLTNTKDKNLDPEYKKPIIQKFKKIKPDTLSITLKVDGSSISFFCGAENVVDGELLIVESGKNIEIKCDAIFKINIRPQHKDNFLSGKGDWFFDLIKQGQHGEGLYGVEVMKGLELKKYTRKNQWGVMNLVDAIMSNVKTGSKKTDLKSQKI